jgi:hypothetical protein
VFFLLFYVSKFLRIEVLLMALFPGSLLRCSYVASTHVVSHLIVLLGMRPFPYQDAKHTNGERGELIYDRRGEIPVNGWRAGGEAASELFYGKRHGSMHSTTSPLKGSVRSTSQTGRFIPG